MDYLTTTMLSGVIYDVIKKGFQVSIITLKSKLKDWFITDHELEILVERINNIEQLEDLNESAICKRLEKDCVIKNLLVNIQQDNSTSQVNQSHSGYGDNVAGDKVINQNNY